MSFTKRALGALAAGAITLPFLASPALAAPGDTQIPTVRDIAAFCANPTATRFADVNATDTFELAIRCIATAGITQGNPGTPQQPQGIGANNYGPQLNVTRGQMTSFIARMIDAAEDREATVDSIRALPTASATNPFPGDVPANYVHLDNIKRLSQAGIVEGNPGTAQQPNGIGANRFGPDLPVSRSQMASFINRAVAYMTTQLGPQAVRDSAGVTAGFVATAPNNQFYLDEQQAVHERNVNGITTARIANGTTNADGTPTRRYNGLGNVTRAQMAGFIARTLATFFESDRSGVADQRILGLLETLSDNFVADSRAGTTATPVVATNNQRTFTATGLANGVTYRITLVKAGKVTRSTETNAITFATRPGTGTTFNLVDTGTPLADIVNVNGATLTAKAPSVTATAVNGTITFIVEGEGAEDVIAVIYVNGGPGQPLTNGGTATGLEVDNLGRPVEFFGVTGVTRFLA